MILGAEIALLLYGLYAIFKGRFSIGKGRDVTGGRARVLGVICLTPWPLGFLEGFVIGFIYGVFADEPPNRVLIAGIEIAVIVIVVIVLSVLGRAFYGQQEREGLESAYSRA